MATKKIFKVIDGPVNIRRTPNGATTNRMLFTGNQVQVDADSRTEAGGYVWWQHHAGWSAERSTAGSVVFMEMVGEVAIPPTPGASADERQFRVVDGPVMVRQRANGALTSKQLLTGDVVTVIAGSRTEAGEYVWWQHSLGWSAERSINGNEVFMEVIVTTGEITPPMDETPETKTTQPDETPAAANTVSDRDDTPDAAADIVAWQVYSSNGLNVRDRPGTGTFAKKTLPFGTLLQVDRSTAFEKDGYVWVKHDQGWSAWKKADESQIFIGEPRENSPSAPQNSRINIRFVDLRPEALPGYQTLIEKTPVKLEETEWFQYFGNNTFAYLNGKAYNYDGYSQGLHGGLDFGNTLDEGIQIRAGLHGKVMRVDRASLHNWKVWIRSGDYVIIYQHITNIRLLSAEQPVTPDTVLAEIEPNEVGGLNHLHFEVRYDNEKYIVNPLWLMPESMVREITTKFNPALAYTGQLGPSASELYYFYKDANWSQWITPLDQPFIIRGGDVVGPTR